MGAEFPLVHKQVELVIDKKRLYRGTVTATDRELLVVRTDPFEPFVGQRGKDILLRVLVKAEKISQLAAKVVEHTREEEGSGEVFLLQPEGQAGQHEARRSPRVALTVRGTLFLTALKGAVLPPLARKKRIPVVIRDISEGGVQLLGQLQLPVDTAVLLTLELRGETYEESAEIVWTRQVGDGFFLYGLRFFSPDFFLLQTVRRMLR